MTAAAAPRKSVLLVALDLLPEDLFTSRDAIASGVSPTQMQRLVAAGLLERTRRGIYRRVQTEAEASTTHAVTRAAIARHLRGLGSHAVAAHLTAAFIHGLRTPWSAQLDDRRLYVIRSPEAAHSRVDAHTIVWPAKFEPGHVLTMEDGITVTTPARTALDVGRGCPFERALVIVDDALRHGVTTDELLRLRQYMNGWPGTRVLRPAIENADARSESGLESQARGVLLASGLPAPELQVPIAVASGSLYRADMAWMEHEVIAEVDGRGKLVSRASLLAEKDREDDLRDLGFRVVRLTHADLVDPSRRRLHRLAEHLHIELKPYNPNWGQTQLFDPQEALARRRKRRREDGAF